MILYDYPRSTAAYRVRIALNLKNIRFKTQLIDLLKGQDKSELYRGTNPQGLVPAILEANDVFTQSLAICEYLDEQHPEPPLLPIDSKNRATVRAIAQSIACDVHPLNNLRVLKYLQDNLGVNDEQKTRWYHHWIHETFGAIERQLEQSSNKAYCFGNSPTLADVCLIPQVFNANRFDCDLSNYPIIRSINAHCLALDAFANATPQ